MKSKTRDRQVVGTIRFSVPIFLSLAMGVTGCASGSRPSLSGLWRRKPAEETAEKKDSGEKKASGKDSQEKSVAAKSPNSSRKPTATRTKPKSEFSSDKPEEKITATERSNRRDRLRAYLKEEDQKKSALAEKTLENDDDPIRRVSKSEKDSDGDVLSSLPKRKSRSSIDPFLEDEDPIAAASKVADKEFSRTEGGRVKDSAVVETGDEPSDLDREMTNLGMKKRSNPESESISRLESLLEDSDQESLKTTNRIARKPSGNGNPFEDLDDESPVAKRKPAPKDSIPHVEDEPETKTASVDSAVRDLPSTDVHEGIQRSRIPNPKSTSNSPRAEADDLILQALAKMKKNEFDEACTLAESAAKLESDHRLEYRAGEESPSKLLGQLNQLRNMMAQDDSPSSTPTQTKPRIDPNPVSLPSLSNDLQPVEDEAADTSDLSPTRRVNFTRETDESSEKNLSVAAVEQQEASAAAVVELPSKPKERDSKAEEAKPTNPFEDLGDEPGSKPHNDGPIFSDPPVEREQPAADITAFASPVSEAGATQTHKASNDSLGMLLVGISLVSLGCAGIFVWRAMRPTTIQNPVPVAVGKKDRSSKKAA